MEKTSAKLNVDEPNAKVVDGRRFCEKMSLVLIRILVSQSLSTSDKRLELAKVISLRLSVIVVASLMVFIGFALFFYGTSMTNPRSVLSGSYMVVIGIFLAIAGFLVLVAHIFRGRSMFY